MPVLRRIVIMGGPGTGKSSLGERLAGAMGVPFVELDALFWEPGWVEADDAVFGARIAEATHGDAWVVAGNYRSHGAGVLWPRADALVCLDLPLRVTFPRLVRRTWRRWRTREVLWGTNVERLWPQLKFWDLKSSLLAYAVRMQGFYRARFDEVARDPALAPQVVRLTSPRAVEAYARAVEDGAG